MCSTCCAVDVVGEYREHQFVVATGLDVIPLSTFHSPPLKNYSSQHACFERVQNGFSFFL